MSDDVDLPRCDMVADDGAQCVRSEHSSDPDAHDFAQQQGNPVDGGQHWSSWIHMVHEARDALLFIVNEDGNIKRESEIAEWDVDYCRAVIADVARALGLEVKRDDSLNSVKITERES